LEGQIQGENSCFFLKHHMYQSIMEKEEN
jgi:hypothetical protein